MSRRLFVALLFHAWALAAVRVTPAQATLGAGATCAFSATLDGAQPPGGWRWSILAGPGDIDERTGLYRAPDAGSAAAVRVRAVPVSGPAMAGEASAMVLPFPAEVAGLVGASLGEPWGQSFTSNLPFLDPETGRRPLPEHRIIPVGPAPWRPGEPGAPEAILAGYGIPLTFDPRPAEPVEGVRLTYREGNALVRRDQCGGGAVELVWRGRVASLCLEALKPSVKEPGKWRSTIVQRPVDLRGVLPFCGSAVAPGGHLDGQGPSARFQQPFGLAHLPGRNGDSRPPRPLLLVTDRGSHVLRTVTPEGRVATLCGQPGQAGTGISPPCWAEWAPCSRARRPDRPCSIPPPTRPSTAGPATPAPSSPPGRRRRWSPTAATTSSAPCAWMGGWPPWRGPRGWRDTGIPSLPARPPSTIPRGWRWTPKAGSMWPTGATG